MGPKMNTAHKQTRLITSLVELEETVVLDLVNERLRAGDDPFEIITDAQQAMKLVGERYEQHNYYISSMMMAGEIFREIMEIVEPVLVSKMIGQESGDILLGTVQGDIHDIGKNIVGILIRCHGFKVTDLGVDVPSAEFVKEALRLKPDIICLSGLLTISYDAMKETIQEIRKLDDPGVAATPFLVGGGTINAMVCGFVGADYWATDAMVGLQLCKQIMAER
jgi:methanogenic corrinoid protein MtbC1